MKQKSLDTSPGNLAALFASLLYCVLSLHNPHRHCQPTTSSKVIKARIHSDLIMDGIAYLWPTSIKTTSGIESCMALKKVCCLRSNDVSVLSEVDDGPFTGLPFCATGVALKMAQEANEHSEAIQFLHLRIDDFQF